MKRRTFYVVNLDRGRIFTLTVLTLSFLVLAYATGYRLGRQNPEPPDYSLQQPLRTLPDQGSLLDAEADLTHSQSELDSEKPQGLSRLDAADVEPLPSMDTTPASVTERSAAQKQSATTENLRSLTAETQTRPLKTDETNSPARKESARPKIGELAKSTAETRAIKAKKPVRSRTPEKVSTKTKKEDRSKVSLRNTASGRKPAEKESTPGIPEKTESTTFRNTAEKAGEAHHALQIGSFYSEKAAGSMSETLRKQGFHPYVEQSDGKYNVRLGRAARKEGINQLEKNLRARHYDPVHVKIP